MYMNIVPLLNIYFFLVGYVTVLLLKAMKAISSFINLYLHLHYTFFHILSSCYYLEKRTLLPQPVNLISNKIIVLHRRPGESGWHSGGHNDPRGGERLA